MILKFISKNSLPAIILIVSFCLFSFAGTAKQTDKSGDELPSLKGKKVLMVWGGWKGHFPKELTDKIVPYLKEQGAIVTVSDSLGVYTNKKIMDETDLIFQSHTMGKITRNRKKDCWKR